MSGFQSAPKHFSFQITTIGGVKKKKKKADILTIPYHH